MTRHPAPARLLALLLALAAAAAAAPNAPRPASDEQLAAIRADKAEAEAMAREPSKAAAAYFASLDARAANLTADGAELPAALASYAAGVRAGGGAARAAYERNFLATLSEVVALNRAADDDVSYGINHMAHLSSDEWARMYTTGRRRRPHRLRKDDGQFCMGLNIWSFTSLASGPMATDIDWRDRGRVTAIKDQGMCGCCVVFANNAVVEATYLAITNNGSKPNKNPPPLSEQDIMDCSPSDQCSGAYGYEFIDRATCNPVAMSKDVPYRGTDDDKCGPKVKRRVSGVKGWTFVPPNQDDMRRALAYNVVSVGLNADGAAFRNYRRGVMKCNTGGKALNHEVALVGYNDKVVLSKASTVAAFLAKNSWGETWGDSGYFQLQADCKAGTKGARALFTDTAMATALIA